MALVKARCHCHCNGRSVEIKWKKTGEVHLDFDNSLKEFTGYLSIIFRICWNAFKYHYQSFSTDALKFIQLLCYLTQLYVTFIDRSTHLGNLFVAVGNTELNNKIASYKTDQKVSVIKTFYSFAGCVAVGRQYRRYTSVRVAPSRVTISCPCNYRDVS